MKKVSEEIIEQLKEKYLSGIGGETLAKEFHLHPNSIRRILKRNHVDIRPLKEKIDPTFEEVKELYDQDWQVYKIADHFNSYRRIIRSILKDKEIYVKQPKDYNRKYQVNEDFFDNITTEAQAYILGFIYADGNVSGNYSLIIDLSSKDAELMYKIEKFIFKDLGNVEIYDRDIKGEFVHFAAHSKQLYDGLAKYGCSESKTFKIRFPHNLDPSLYHHFIRGYFDGDGSVNAKMYRGTGTSLKIISNLDFVKQLKHIIEQSVDVNFYLSEPEESITGGEKFTATISLLGNHNTLKMYNYLYKDATIYLERKRFMFLATIAKLNYTNTLAKAGTRGYPKRYICDLPSFLPWNKILTQDELKSSGWIYFNDFNLANNQYLNSNNPVELCYAFCYNLYEHILDKYNNKEKLDKAINYLQSNNIPLSFENLFHHWNEIPISIDDKIKILEENSNLGDVILDLFPIYGEFLIAAAKSNRKYQAYTREYKSLAMIHGFTDCYATIIKAFKNKVNANYKFEKSDLILIHKDNDLELDYIQSLLKPNGKILYV